jgi:isoquinoline 1-oxidoreductase beta subunit
MRYSMKIEQINLNRRTLFKAAGITATSGLLYSITACSQENASTTQLNDIKLYLNIDETHLRFLLPRAEMGQDLATSFAMIIAEEMHFPLHLIKVDFADADPLLGDQMTVGSASIRTWWQKLRDMGASFRACALHYATNKFAVDPEDFYFEDGYLLARNNTFKIEYLALLRETPLTTNIVLSPTKQKDFKVIGHPISSNSAKAKATGIFKYLGDYELSDLGLDDKFSYILNAVSITYKNHWPKPNSLKLKQWQQQFKLDYIIELKQSFSGFDYRLVLISQKTWPLLKCKQVITRDLEQALKDPEFIGLPPQEFDRLDTKTTIKRNQNNLECSFYTPEIAHAPMETQTAIALFHKEQGLEIWAPTQAPQRARKRVAKKLDLKESNITLHACALGGSFGRKRYDDFIIEAALISQTMLKKGHRIPIKLLWTREDDLGREHYRPATFQSLNWSSKDKTKIQHRLIESHRPHLAPQSSEHSFFSHLDWEIKTQKSSLPGKHITGIWRSINHGYLAFSICSFVDELSYVHAQDPIEYSRQHIASLGLRQQLKVSIDPSTRYQPERLLNTINTVEQLSGWPINSQVSSALGFASYYCFGSYISIVVKLSLDIEQLKIEHIWASVDCGIAIHPDGLKAQIEGGLLFGLSACLYGKMPKESELLTVNFDQYQVARMSDVPEIEVHIQKSTFDPTGAGELGVPPIAPAIANAYRKLTGKRFLRMPFLKNGKVNHTSLAKTDISPV